MSSNETPGEVDVTHEHFEDLRALIDEELTAQLAIGRLGPVAPPANGVMQVSGLIADVVVRVYRLERRTRSE